MNAYFTLFFGMFTTLLAIINPLEAIPVFLGLLQGKDSAEQRRVARKACLYALLLMFFFLIFGNLLLRLFEVPLSMIRVVGGVILMRIGFELFAPSPDSSLIPSGGKGDEDVAFIPMAMPIMFGPGAIATVIGLTSTIKDSDRAVLSFAVVALAIAPPCWSLTSRWPTPTPSSRRLARKASMPRPASSVSSFRRWAWA